jgi:hypothetical protein
MRSMSELPSMQGRLHRDASECIFDVRFWHKADIETALMNVRFREKSGHCKFDLSCPLVTQSGHWQGLGSIFAVPTAPPSPY